MRGKQENRWDDQLGEVAFVLNNRTNSATGQSPSQLLFGAPMARPGEWRHPNRRQQQPRDAQASEQRMRRARARQAVFQRRLYPEPREAPLHFRVGEMVLVRSFPGVRTPYGVTWEGPYPVVAVRGENVYEIDRNGAQDLVHLDDIRPAPGAQLDPRNDRDELINLPEAEPHEDAGGDEEGNVAEEEVGDQEGSDEEEPDGVGGNLDPDEDLGERNETLEPGGPEPAIENQIGEQPENEAELLPILTVQMSRQPSREDVLVEDVPEPEMRGCQHTGVPIVGLWP